LLDIPKFVTADQHWNHRRIGGYCKRPDEHNELMVRGWNAVVGPNDQILHLGDLALGLPEQMEAIAPRLNGEKYLILGNHDRWPPSLYESWGFKVIQPYVTTYSDYVVWFGHYPHEPKQLKEDEISIHGHKHGVSFDGQTQRHVDVGVDRWWGRPVDTHWVLEQTTYRMERGIK
jgi:calcineurin-like phosphoesterase family protein